MERLIAFIAARTESARRDLAFLALTFGLVALQFLGRYPLLEPDEGRYAEIPREMLEKLDFITPTLNYVKYFEKPPLLYWLNALSMAIFGENEFAVRLPCALCGLLTILFTYWLGRRLFDRRIGLLAAIFVGTSIGFLPQARITLTDMPLTLWLTVSLGCFGAAMFAPTAEKARYYYLAYAAAAMAVLAKGLIGLVFPAAIAFLYMLCRRRWHILREMRLLTGMLLLLAIASPWFVLVSQRNPEFARFFFIHEHFERFLTKVHGRYQPFWYFLPVLAGVMLPWSFFIPAALRDAWRQRSSAEGDRLAWLATWALFIFLFFSKSSSKLIPYILPVVPPLALLLARSCRHWLDRPRALRFALLAGGSFLAVQIVAGHLAYSRQAEKKTARPLALKLRELAGPDDIVAMSSYDHQTLPFYAKRRVIVVGGRNELEFGSKQGDQSGWFIEKPELERLWQGDRRVFYLMKKDDLEQFTGSRQSAVKLLGANRKKALVSNR